MLLKSFGKKSARIEKLQQKLAPFYLLFIVMHNRGSDSRIESWTLNTHKKSFQTENKKFNSCVLFNLHIETITNYTQNTNSLQFSRCSLVQHFVLVNGKAFKAQYEIHKWFESQMVCFRFKNIMNEWNHSVGNFFRKKNQLFHMIQRSTCCAYHSLFTTIRIECEESKYSDEFRMNGKTRPRERSTMQ